MSTSALVFRLDRYIYGFLIGAPVMFLVGFFGIWFVNGLRYRPPGEASPKKRGA